MSYSQLNAFSLKTLLLSLIRLQVLLIQGLETDKQATQLYGGHGAEKSWQFDRHYLRRYTFMLDVRVVFFSFVINIVGKQRVQAWLQKV